MDVPPSARWWNAQRRYVKLLHLPVRAHTLHAALADVLREFPQSLGPSLTWDQRTETATHLDVTIDTGATIYFCDAAGPWRRTNQNTNGLLRQYLPKPTDLSVHTPKDLARVEAELKRRARITLDGRSPGGLFAPLLASHSHPSLR